MVGITPIRNPYLRDAGESLGAWMDRIDRSAATSIEDRGVHGWLTDLTGQRKHAVITELNHQIAQVHYAGTTARGMAERDPDTLKRIMRNS